MNNQATYHFDGKTKNVSIVNENADGTVDLAYPGETTVRVHGCPVVEAVNPALPSFCVRLSAPRPREVTFPDGTPDSVKPFLARVLEADEKAIAATKHVEALQKDLDAATTPAAKKKFGLALSSARIAMEAADKERTDALAELHHAEAAAKAAANATGTQDTPPADEGGNANPPVE